MRNYFRIALYVVKHGITIAAKYDVELKYFETIVAVWYILYCSFINAAFNRDHWFDNYILNSAPNRLWINAAVSDKVLQL